MNFAFVIRTSCYSSLKSFMWQRYVARMNRYKSDGHEWFVTMNTHFVCHVVSRILKQLRRERTLARWIVWRRSRGRVLFPNLDMPFSHRQYHNDVSAVLPTLFTWASFHCLDSCSKWDCEKSEQFGKLFGKYVSSRRQRDRTNSD